MLEKLTQNGEKAALATVVRTSGSTYRKEGAKMIISEKGKEVRVKPQLVVEINYEEIQKSPNYASGFALRFPRFISLREERDPSEISTLETVKNYFREQR